jgi:hypothetical protein
MKWVLVFYLMNPQDYKIHTAYIHQENCIAAQTRFRDIFSQTNSKMHAECRRENQIQLHRPTTVVFYRETVVE